MNMEQRKVLCMVRGGSHSYGLNTPTSDIDFRGVFVNTDAEYLVGLKRDEVLVEQDEQRDTVLTEFRHALKLLRSANTQMVELLFADTFESCSSFWKSVQHSRMHLVDGERLFKSLLGYMQSELRLANGERTGKLGGKRKEAIDKYGFSPKNFVQLLRLAWAGQLYFKTGVFPVNIFKVDRKYGELLMLIKTQPARFTKEQLNEMVREAEDKLRVSFENRRVITVFDEDLATYLCLNLYGPLIAELPRV